MQGINFNIFNNIDSPIKLIYGLLCVILIVYNEMITPEIKQFAETILGKIIAIVILYFVTQFMGWPYGILTALVFVMLLRNNYSLSEGFSGGGTINEKRIVGKRWFVEKVLGEKPKKIETDKVYTSAIEGITNNTMMD
jgi:uncharacterized membrane protein